MTKCIIHIFFIFSLLSLNGNTTFYKKQHSKLCNRLVGNSLECPFSKIPIEFYFSFGITKESSRIKPLKFNNLYFDEIFQLKLITNIHYQRLNRPELIAVIQMNFYVKISRINYLNDR